MPPIGSSRHRSTRANACWARAASSSDRRSSTSNGASPTTLGAKHCVGVGNGLDALTLALAAHGVGAGRRGDRPGRDVRRDLARGLPRRRHARTRGVHEATFTLDPVELEAAITPRTRAVVPVHLYGHPADLDPITEIARRHGLVVIDDAAQAHGARYRGRPIGGLDVSHGVQLLPHQEPGRDGRRWGRDHRRRRHRRPCSHAAQLRDAREVPERAPRLEQPARPAAGGDPRRQARRLDEWNARRRRVAARYHEALDGSSWLQLPREAAWARHVYHLFVVRVPCRRRARAPLAARSIETGMHYPVPPYRQPVYRHLGVAVDAFASLDAVHDEVLSLPMGPHLTRRAAGPGDRGDSTQLRPRQLAQRATAPPEG